MPDHPLYSMWRGRLDAERALACDLYEALERRHHMPLPLFVLLGAALGWIIYSLIFS